MKKDTILKAIAVIILVFALRSVAQENYASPGENIDCQECCRQGRFASDECGKKCNFCRQYNDKANAEFDDYPF